MRWVVALMLTAWCLLQPVHILAAGSEGGATVGVSVFLSGFSTPSVHWHDPCTGEQFSEYYAGRIEPTNFRDRATQITTMQLSIDMGRESAIARYGPDIVNRLIKAEVQYQRYCLDPESRDYDPASWSTYWVPVVSQETVVPALFEHIWNHVSPPVVSWPSMDRDFGWLYVQAPMDFRVQWLEPVSITASVTNITGSVSAWVSATPVSLTLEPGEPGGVPVVCPIEASTANYSAASPGLCSYTYGNSSAVEADGVFGVHASVLWRIETSDRAFVVGSIRTWSSSEVAVAEVQAVVTG